MTDNLPARRDIAAPAPVLATDTDSWITVVGSLAKLADTVSTTEFVPRNLRGKPAAVTAALLYGREVGLAPMTALTMTHVVEGKPAMSAEGMRALVLSAGHDLEVLEASGGLVRMRGRRRGAETWTSLEWSIDMARAAGLAGKQVWTSYPRAMLLARCTAELCRMIFPDVIHGFRAMEELDEVDEPEQQASAVAAQTTTVRRRTAKKALPAAAPQPAAAGSRQRPTSPGVPLPGEEGFEQLGGARPSKAEEKGTSQPDDSADTGDSGEVDAPPVDPSESSSGPAGEVATPGADAKRGSGPSGGAAAETSAAPAQGDRADADAQQARPSPAAEEPVDAQLVEEAQVEETPPAQRPTGSVTRAQLNMLHASFTGLGLKGEAYRDERLSLCSRILRKDVESTSDLSKDEASTLIDTLARVDNVADLHALLDAHDEG